MFLFLDDYRNPLDVTWIKIPVPPRGQMWTVVRSYDEFVAVFGQLKEAPLHVSFDHDLADEHYNPDTWGKSEKDYKEKTGLHCARAMVEICLDKHWKLPSYTVHSMNPIGAKNIDEELKAAKKRWF